MTHNPWFLCVPVAVLGFTACGIIWLMLYDPEATVNPDKKSHYSFLRDIGRDPKAFGVSMVALGRCAWYILFEAKADPEPPSSRAGAKSRANKEAYLSLESQRLWVFRCKCLPAVIALVVTLCFDNLSTYFPTKTMARYVWVWAIFGPALPFLVAMVSIPIMEISRRRCQRARLGMDHVDVEKGYAENSDEDDDDGDDGATTDTEKQHTANYDDKGKDKRHE
ncbi:hypothetical protein PG996_002541 [Apiospora saccharicola]|uniref:Uncharacterized protein n=1 Tax=Apiospora saccharicola TaxID=335842 RepID=A0ABR1WJS9_9PEZI